MAGLIGVALGSLAGLLHQRSGDLSQVYLGAESFFFRFAYFAAAVACGRVASGIRQAVAAGPLLALGASVAMTVIDLVRDVPPPYPPAGDASGIALYLLWSLVLPSAGVVLAHLTRRDGLGGDLAMSALVQGQTVPAVLSLWWDSADGECCVAVEWGYPWQDWAGLALALVLVIFLRPSLGARLRTLATTILLTTLVCGLALNLM
ncbi:hypothetical protein ACWEN6_07925 [Sphaerisporangium sp. NPDC004334]